MKHDENNIEELLLSCYEASFDGEEDVDYLSEKKCFTAIKQYAEHMVRKERENICNIVKTVQSKNDSNGRYNACKEILDLLK